MLDYLHYLGYLEDILTNYNIEILFGLIVAVLILFIFNIINRVKVFTMSRRYKRIMQLLQVKEVSSMEDTLINYLEKSEFMGNKVDEMELRLEEMAKKVNLSVQRVEIMRYNAFEDMGSDLSFSIALLDENLDGFIITNIYAREESNVYAKPITNGETRYPLSIEEIQVLDRAKGKLAEAK